MASGKDAAEILGLAGGAVKAPTDRKKKKKPIVDPQPRLSGMSREVQALMGDSVPPLQLVDITPKYKSKPSLGNKLYRPRHWDERQFNPATRSDGLVLKHWKRAVPSTRQVPIDGDAEMTNGDQSNIQSEPQYEDEFPMEKWAVAIRVPDYTEEQYVQYFKTSDWTKEETDYLMRLASDYDLRWILIADRYDPEEIREVSTDANTAGVTKQYPPRTMEQLKQRYYQVAAQDLEMRTPKANMNPSEFALYEKMRNFNAKTEELRKSMAEKLFERTKEEAEEERALLEELNRITKNEEDFINMRKDLYARLEAAPSLRRNERGEEQNIVLSSAGLSDLLSRLFAKEKHLKRRVAPNDPASAAPTSAAEGRSRAGTTLSRRETLETPTEKKGSISQTPITKQMSKAEEEKYGVSHPAERLTSGVSFRHEKINRVTAAKSQVQTQKINAALTELGIPARLSMPTEKVCKEFERLVGQIQLLLDARKTLTRVTEEVKTLEEMKRQRLGLPAPATADGGTAMQVDGAEAQTVNSSAAQTAPDEIQDGAVDGEPGPTVEDDEDDAEAEDDVDDTNLEQTQVDEDDEVDNTLPQDESFAQEDEKDEDDESDEEEGQEEEDDDDDEEGTAVLRRGAENIDDDDDEDEHPAPLVEEGDEDEEEEEEEPDEGRDKTQAQNDSDDEEDPVDKNKEQQDVTMEEVEPAEDDPDIIEADTDAARPTSAGSRGHKRGASVVSDASGAGSNRSGAARKRKR